MRGTDGAALLAITPLQQDSLLTLAGGKLSNALLDFIWKEMD
jgi:hypothetical protein